MKKTLFINEKGKGLALKLCSLLFVLLLCLPWQKVNAQIVPSGSDTTVCVNELATYSFKAAGDQSTYKWYTTSSNWRSFGLKDSTGTDEIKFVSTTERLSAPVTIVVQKTNPEAGTEKTFTLKKGETRGTCEIVGKPILCPGTSSETYELRPTIAILSPTYTVFWGYSGGAGGAGVGAGSQQPDKFIFQANTNCTNDGEFNVIAHINFGQNDSYCPLMCSFPLKVEDITPPTITHPEDIYLNCYNVDSINNLIAKWDLDLSNTTNGPIYSKDNCGGEIKYNVSRVLYTHPTQKYIDTTHAFKTAIYWTATDDCNNTATDSTVIHISMAGNPKPTTAVTDSTKTVACPSSITQITPSFIVKDSCGRIVSNPEVRRDSAIITCYGNTYIATYTFSYIYKALNDSTYTWKYTYNVTTNSTPILTPGTDTSATVYCLADEDAAKAYVSQITLPTVKDQCAHILSPSDTAMTGFTAGACKDTVTYTFTYRDCYNNSLAWNFYLYVSSQDTMKFDGLNADKYVVNANGKVAHTDTMSESNGCLPTTPESPLTPKDYCDRNMTLIAETPVRTGATCKGLAFYAFRYVDCKADTFTVYRVYNLTPTTTWLSGISASASKSYTLSCLKDTTNAAYKPAAILDTLKSLGLKDDCGRDLTIVFDSVRTTSVDCPGANYYYTFSDCAGNKATATVAMYVVQKDFATKPEYSKKVVCVADLLTAPKIDTIKITSSCGDTLTGTKVGDPTFASETGYDTVAIYKFAYEDCTGNKDTLTYKLLLDIWKPTITLTSNGNVCRKDTVWPTYTIANDSCNKTTKIDSTVLFTGKNSSESDCIGVYTFTYTFDISGDNRFTYTKVVTLKDTIKMKENTPLADIPIAMDPCKMDTLFATNSAYNYLSILDTLNKTKVVDSCGNEVFYQALDADSVIQPTTNTACTGTVTYKYFVGYCYGKTDTIDYTFTFTANSFSLTTKTMRDTVPCVSGIKINKTLPAPIAPCGSLSRSHIDTVGMTNSDENVDSLVRFRIEYSDCTGKKDTLNYYVYVIDTYKIPADSGRTISCPTYSGTNHVNVPNPLLDCYSVTYHRTDTFPTGGIVCEGSFVHVYAVKRDQDTVGYWKYTDTVKLTPTITNPAPDTVKLTLECIGDTTTNYTVAAIADTLYKKYTVKDACNRVLRPAHIGTTINTAESCTESIVHAYRYVNCSGSGADTLFCKITIKHKPFIGISMDTLRLPIVACPSTVTTKYLNDTVSKYFGLGCTGDTIKPKLVGTFSAPGTCATSATYKFAYTDSCYPNTDTLTVYIPIKESSYSASRYSRNDTVHCFSDIKPMTLPTGQVDNCNRAVTFGSVSTNRPARTEDQIAAGIDTIVQYSWTAGTTCKSNLSTLTQVIYLMKPLVAPDDSTGTVACLSESKARTADYMQALIAKVDSCEELKYTLIDTVYGVGTDEPDSYGSDDCVDYVKYKYTLTDTNLGKTVNWNYVDTIKRTQFSLSLDTIVLTYHCKSEFVGNIRDDAGDTLNNLVVLDNCSDTIKNPVVDYDMAFSAFSSDTCTGYAVYPVIYTDCSGNKDTLAIKAVMDYKKLELGSRSGTVTCVSDLTPDNAASKLGSVTDSCGNTLNSIGNYAGTLYSNPCNGRQAFYFIYKDCAGQIDTIPVYLSVTTPRITRNGNTVTNDPVILDPVYICNDTLPLLDKYAFIDTNKIGLSRCGLDTTFTAERTVSGDTTFHHYMLTQGCSDTLRLVQSAITLNNDIYTLEPKHFCKGEGEGGLGEIKFKVKPEFVDLNIVAKVTYPDANVYDWFPAERSSLMAGTYYFEITIDECVLYDTVEILNLNDVELDLVTDATGECDRRTAFPNVTVIIPVKQIGSPDTLSVTYKVSNASNPDSITGGTFIFPVEDSDDTLYNWRLDMSTISSFGNNGVDSIIVELTEATIPNATDCKFVGFDNCIIFTIDCPDDISAAFELDCPKDTIVEIPWGACEYKFCSLADMPRPTFTAFTDDLDNARVNIFYSYFKGGVQLNHADLHFGPGVHEIMLVGKMTVYDCEYFDTCYYNLIVNFGPCGDNSHYITGVDGDGRPIFGNTGALTLAIDAEGNEYTTVLIDCDCWTAENLRSTQYADSTAIDTFYIYNTDVNIVDTLPNVEKWGLLYNWNTASRNQKLDEYNRMQGLCPAGWYLPTKENYENLLRYGAFALSAQNEWLGVNNTTDSTGFSALPSGYYNDLSRSFYYLLGDAYFWTANAHGLDMAWVAHIHFDCDDLMLEGFKKERGASVRCVKVDYDHCNIPPTITDVLGNIEIGCDSAEFGIRITANNRIAQPALLRVTITPANIADSIQFMRAITNAEEAVSFTNGVAYINESGMASGLTSTVENYKIKLKPGVTTISTATITWAIVDSANRTEVWSAVKTTELKISPAIAPTMEVVFEENLPFTFNCDTLRFQANIDLGNCYEEAQFSYTTPINGFSAYYTKDTTTAWIFASTPFIPVDQKDTIYFYIVPNDTTKAGKTGEMGYTLLDLAFGKLSTPAEFGFSVGSAAMVDMQLSTKHDVIDSLNPIISASDRILHLSYAPDTFYVHVNPGCVDGKGLIKIQGHTDITPYMALEYYRGYEGATGWELIEFDETGLAWFDGGATGGFDIASIQVMMRVRQNQCTPSVMSDGKLFSFVMIAADSTTVVSNVTEQYVICNVADIGEECIFIENDVDSVCGSADFEVKINIPTSFGTFSGVKAEVIIALAEPTYKDSITLSFLDLSGGSPGNWESLTFDNNGEVVFDGGVSGGFPFGGDRNYPVNFNVVAAENLANHRLPFTLTLVDASNHSVVYATLKDTVTLMTGGAKIVEVAGKTIPAILAQTTDSAHFTLSVDPIGCMEDTAAYVMIKFGAPKSIALAFANNFTNNWTPITFNAADSTYQFNGGVADNAGFPLNGNVAVEFRALSRAMDSMKNVPYAMWVIAASDRRVLSDTLEGTITLAKNMFAAKTTHRFTQDISVPIQSSEFKLTVDTLDFNPKENAKVKFTILNPNTNGNKWADSLVLTWYDTLTDASNKAWETLSFTDNVLEFSLENPFNVFSSKTKTSIDMNLMANVANDQRVQILLEVLAVDDKEVLSRPEGDTITVTLRRVEIPCEDCLAALTDSVKDAEGNVYKTVLMPDGRWWMAQNLKTSVYPDGTSIENRRKTNAPGYVKPSQNTAEGTQISQFSDLVYNQYYYNWAAAMGIKGNETAESYYDTVTFNPRGICPEGWHIPSLAEHFALVAAVREAYPTVVAEGNEGALWACPNSFWHYTENSDILEVFENVEDEYKNPYCFSLQSTINVGNESVDNKNGIGYSSEFLLRYVNGENKNKAAMFLLPGNTSENGSRKVGEPLAATGDFKGTSSVRCIKDLDARVDTIKHAKNGIDYTFTFSFSAPITEKVQVVLTHATMSFTTSTDYVTTVYGEVSSDCDPSSFSGSASAGVITFGSTDGITVEDNTLTVGLRKMTGTDNLSGDWTVDVRKMDGTTSLLSTEIIDGNLNSGTFGTASTQPQPQP